MAQQNNALEDRLRRMIVSNNETRNQADQNDPDVQQLGRPHTMPLDPRQSGRTPGPYEAQFHTQYQQQQQHHANSRDGWRRQFYSGQTQQPQASSDSKFQQQWRSNQNNNASNYNRQQFQSQQYTRQGPSNDEYRLRARAAGYLTTIANQVLPPVEMTEAERVEKEAFRKTLEHLCHNLCASEPDHLPSVNLACFGSFASGFASAGSDMDLVIVPVAGERTSAQFSLSEDDLPRRLEKILLQQGYGARLLTRTRVPIIKVCEKPSSPLLSQLRQERERWDMLPREQKYPHLAVDEKDGSIREADALVQEGEEQVEEVESQVDTEQPSLDEDKATPQLDGTATESPKVKKIWQREREGGPLDFPKDGVGIQCDINFFNPLGLHNTQLLRCYSLCDPRVRPMILFVKAWAKKRKINSSYSGTLSSYGYVLMVLHYLMNVVRPPVLPNLQQAWRPNPACTPQGVDQSQVDEWKVDFWRREDEILAAVSKGQLSHNRDSLGELLVGFFFYYASQRNRYSFFWMKQVLSLRTVGGTLSKEQKGWVKAKTEESAGNKVQYRYLFCIEDPFELDHNVARTVTHFGLVAIRDEFRRAGQILNDAGMGQPLTGGGLFDDVQDEESSSMSKPRPTKSKDPAQVTLDSKDDKAFPSLADTKEKSSQHGSKKSKVQAMQALQAQPGSTPAKTTTRHGKAPVETAGQQDKAAVTTTAEQDRDRAITATRQIAPAMNTSTSTERSSSTQPDPRTVTDQISEIAQPESEVNEKPKKKYNRKRPQRKIKLDLT